MIDAKNDLSFQHAERVLKERGYTYEVKEGGAMMWVQSKSGKVYAFYPTTYRWAPRNLRGKHYRAKSVEDFLDRFVERGDDEQEKFKSLVESATGVPNSNATLYDLIHYIYDDFESGKSVGQVCSEIHKLFWQEVKRDI